MVIEEIDLFVLFDEIVNIKEMKKKNLFWLVSLLFVISLPFILNFVLTTPSPIPEKWRLGKPEDWLNFWAIYVGSLCTFLMSLIAYKTLKQNEKLVEQNDLQLKEIKRQWEEQNSVKLSCSLAVRSSELLIEITNTSPVPAHNVKVVLENNTTEIDDDLFQDLCENLNNMRFEIIPFEKKQIPIRGIQPYIDGNYGGTLKVTLSYDNKQEIFNLSPKEINVTKWQSSISELCMKLDDIKSSIDKFSHNIR